MDDRETRLSSLREAARSAQNTVSPPRKAKNDPLSREGLAKKFRKDARPKAKNRCLRATPPILRAASPSGTHRKQIPYVGSYRVGGVWKLQFRTGDAEADDGTIRTVISAGADPLAREQFREAGQLPKFRETYVNGLSDQIVKPRAVPRQRRKSKSSSRKGATIVR